MVITEIVCDNHPDMRAWANADVLARHLRECHGLKAKRCIVDRVRVRTEPRTARVIADSFQRRVRRQFVTSVEPVEQW